MLKGKKTYLVATAAIVYAVSAVIYGAIDPVTAIQIIMNALGIAGLRDAIS